MADKQGPPCGCEHWGDELDLSDDELKKSDRAIDAVLAWEKIEEAGFDRTEADFTDPSTGRVIPKGKGFETERNGRKVVYSLPALAHYFPDLAKHVHVLMERWL